MFKYDKNNDKEIDKEEFDTFLQDLKDNIGRDAAGYGRSAFPFGLIASEFVPKIPFAVLALDNLPDGSMMLIVYLNLNWRVRKLCGRYERKGVRCDENQQKVWIRVFSLSLSFLLTRRQGWYVNLDLGHTIKDIHDALAAAKKNNTNSANPNETELVGKCTIIPLSCHFNS